MNLQSQSSADAGVAILAADAAPARYEFPASFAQRRLWFIHQLEPQRSTYNVPWFLRLTGALDRAALQASLDELVRRHEILRTTLPLREGEPVQQVHEATPVVLPLDDLAALPAEARAAQAERLRRAEADAAFDLTRGPLLRARLVRLGAEQHELLVTLHHVASDAWSKGILARELAALYEAFSQGRPAPLPAPGIQHADFSVWQRRWLASAGASGQLEYWTRQLADVPALELPIDYARPQASSWPAGVVRLDVPGEVSARLRELWRREGATAFIGLLAAFHWLLGRSAGQDDLTVGTVIAARRRRETHGLVGCLLNTLVLRADLRGAPSFRELIARTRRRAVDAYANQDVPYDQLVETLAPRRQRGRAPLFQAAFAVESEGRPASQAAGLRIEEFAVELERAKFELFLSLDERPDGLSGELQYAADLFARASMQRLVRHYARLLEVASAQPDTPLPRLAWLDEHDRAALVAWNRTQREYPREAGLGELFEEQVRARAHEPAVVHGGTRLTYAELERRSNRLARHLRGLGVRAETRVGLCFERGVDLVVGMLSILKAGGAYVPLDPSYPSERLVYMVEDSGARLILTEEAFRGRFWETNVESVCVDELRGELGRQSEEALERVGGGGHLAYVMYTSGSTGTPKGIMVEQRAVSRLVLNSDYVELRASERVAQVSNASFDAATFEIWGALLNGATLVVIDKEIALSPTELGRTLSREGVTAMFLTTALFNQVARESREAFGGLRHLLFGGEAVDPRAVREVTRSGHAPERLLHVYGPTETTTFATWFEVGEVDERARTIPIGRPLANTQVHVLDEALEPVPVGLPGEIYIGGPGLARGYWGRAELTAERFVPDPFGEEGGGRLYRTGDKARRRDDGALEFLGRVDDQVKLRGYRIEVGEIAAVLKQDESLADAFVLLRDDDGDRRLVAYVVAKPGADARPSALRETLRSRLPEYMLPSAIMLLPELPLNVNGKVDRHALPAPADDDQERQEYVAPSGALEEALCRIWAESLRVERVGATDNFFDLGGHSLLATRLLARVKSELGIDVALRALFEHPTVVGFAREIAPSLDGARAAETIARVERGATLALSPAQQRLWFLHQLEPDSGAYNVPLFLRLVGLLDVEALAQSLAEITRRHEVLRTTFPVERGEPVQRVAAPARVRLPLVDLTGLPQAARHGLAQALCEDEANRPFDLATGPLLRARLLRTGPQEHAFLLTLHHVVTDGWSQAILVRELRALYAARLAGQPAALAELPIQYADYAAWQQRWLKGEVQARQLAYWRERLAGVPVLDLATDQPRTQIATHPQAARAMRLSAATSAALRQLAQREGATLFMALLAGFQWLLGRYARQDDVAVGTVVANRGRHDVEDLIGFFVNTLVLRADLRGRPSFRTLLGRARESALSAYAHQDVPFEKLVEELNPARDLGRTPFFQALLLLQNVPETAWDLPGLRVEDVSVELREAKFELSLILADGAAGIEGRLGYASDLFEAETIEQFLRHYVVLLEQAVERPDAPLDALALLQPHERRRILFEWNASARELPTQRPVADWIAEHARRTPHDVAIGFEGERLTYVELHERSSRLARYLVGRGVGRETCVGVGLERGLNWAVALLAVWKAGAAYVPLDLAYPKERRAFMVHDARIGLLLTELGMLDEFPEHPCTVCLDDEWEAIEAAEPGDLGLRFETASLAYATYTSGSTGKPKGVLVEQRGMLNHLWAKVHDLGLQRGDVVVQNARASFDVSVWQLFAPLLVGAQVQILGDELSRDGLQQLAEIERLGVSVMETVPSLLAVMVEQEERNGAERLRLPRLRCLISNAEALPVELAERWLALFPDVRLLNTYGATEASDDVTHHVLTPGRRGGSPFAPLGTPLPNLTVYVLDDALEPVPFGVAGEIYLGGDGVGRGYLDRPALTAERFVPDPFDVRPGRRLYRTGDLGRLGRERSLEFVGRTDFQVKLRGHRVELGEIEGALLEHDDVSQAYVMLREDRPGDARLAAYVVARGGVDGDALRAALGPFLGARLPEYMVPAAVVLLPELPLTVNGKIDRRALPEPEGDAQPARTYVAPSTELETVLCGLWAQLLQVPQVGVHDNFFALGGHSLLATQVVSRLRALLQIEAPVAAVFRSPTVATLAVELERLRGAAQQPKPIVAADRAAFRARS